MARSHFGSSPFGTLTDEIALFTVISTVDLFLEYHRGSAAIGTTVLNTNSDMEVMISGTITIIICFIALYCGYTGIQRITNFPNKRMYQQLKCFASDLQGVLDTQFSNSIFK